MLPYHDGPALYYPDLLHQVLEIKEELMKALIVNCQALVQIPKSKPKQLGLAQ